MVVTRLPDGVSVTLPTLAPGVTIRQSFTSDRRSTVAAVEALPLAFAGHLTLGEIVEKVEYARARGPSPSKADRWRSRGCRTWGAACYAETSPLA
jgi:hypothetical protein